MNIAAKISELLFEYECVVLPGFGGFISNDKPARLNTMSHQFKPPFREILFNVQLSANDGLLTKYIAQEESISYKEAKIELEKFVRWCQNELKTGKQLHFAQIGLLSYDEKQNIVFEQDSQFNYNPDSFGLNSLISPAIKRISQEEKIKGIILSVPKVKKRIDRKPEQVSDKDREKTRKSVYPFPLAIASLLLLVIVITSLFMTQQSSVISLAGLFSPHSEEASPSKTLNQLESNNEFVESTPKAVDFQENVGEQQLTDSKGQMQILEEKETTEELAEEVSDQGSNSDDIVLKTVTGVSQPTPAKLEPEIEKSIPKIQASKRYYIIAGSFSEQVNAKKLVQQLLEKGYSAIVADTSQNGMYRVAYAGFENWTTAKQELLAIRQDENKEAWVLKK